MQFEPLQRYLVDYFHDVPGWCSAQLWQIITPIVEHQDSHGVRNPIAEIGVFHGKFFFGLLATKQALRGNYAIDVFGEQQFNLDGAGEGNLSIFRDNVGRLGFLPESVEVIAGDSTSITSEQISEMRKASGGFSLFSVDGCHLPEHTVNDLTIAMELTVPSGLIFVDDYTNPDWPGVVEGVAKMFFAGYPRFVPLVVAHNKLFMCHLSHHAHYLALVEARLSAIGVPIRRLRRFGYDCLTAHLDPGSKNYLGVAS